MLNDLLLVIGDFTGLSNILAVLLAAILLVLVLILIRR